MVTMAWIVWSLPLTPTVPFLLLPPLLLLLLHPLLLLPLLLSISSFSLLLSASSSPFFSLPPPPFIVPLTLFILISLLKDTLVIDDYSSTTASPVPELDTVKGGNNSILNSRGSVVSGSSPATTLEFIRALAGKISTVYMQFSMLFLYSFSAV